MRCRCCSGSARTSRPPGSAAWTWTSRPRSARSFRRSSCSAPTCPAPAPAARSRPPTSSWSRRSRRPRWRTTHARGTHRDPDGRAGRRGADRGSGPGVVVRVELRVVRPLLGELVLGEAGVDRARLDARVAVDALLGIDVEHLDVVVVGLVRRRVDAIDRAYLDARVVLRADARLCDDVGHKERRIVAAARWGPGTPEYTRGDVERP